MNIRPTGAELFHGAWAGGQAGETDTRKLTVDFNNFANEPKKKPTKCSFPFYESYGKILFVFARYNFVTNDINSLATPESYHIPIQNTFYDEWKGAPHWSSHILKAFFALFTFLCGLRVRLLQLYINFLLSFFHSSCVELLQHN
jgi:hypothetical protein